MAIKYQKENLFLDKEGNPVVAYICPYRKPIDYIVLKDCLGDIKRSFFKDDPELDTLVLKEGEFFRNLRMMVALDGTKIHQK